MALDETRHPGHDRIRADLETLRAILNLPNYQPMHQSCNAQTLSALAARLENAEHAEQRAETAYADAREETITAAWALHNTILEAKVQVVAQYGVNSTAVEAIGLKKKSARRRPARRAAAAD